MVKMFNWFKKKEAPKPAPQKEERAFDRFLELQKAQDNSPIPSQKLTKDQQDELLKLSFPLGKVQMKDAQSGQYAMDADFSYQDLQGMITDAGRADDRIFTFYAKHGFIGWQLCSIISQNWLVANACSIPAEDAVRPLWRNIIKKKTELETDEEKEEEATELTDLTLKKYQLAEKLRQHIKNSRVFGVSYALLCIDGIDYSQPFNLDSVRPGSFKGISIIDPVWLAPQWNSGALNNPGSPNFYEPDYYQVNGLGRVHRSHFIKLIHEEVPDILKPSYYFGGLGVAQMIYERVYAAERTANEAPLLALTKRLLVVPTNLITLAAKPEVAWKLIKMLVFGRDNQGVYFTEEGEKNQVHQVDTSLSDFDAVIMTQYQLVAAISRIPAHKLLKTDPKGLNNNGLYTIKDYTQELQSLQEKAARPFVERVNAVTLRSDLYELKGVEQVITEFNPIDMPTEKEKAEVESMQAQTAAQYVAAGILSPEEVRKALRSERGGRFADIEEELPADEIPDDLELPEEEPAIDSWEESKHPRKDNGQFGTGSGESQKPTNNTSQEHKTLKEFLGKEFTGIKGQAAVEKLLEEKQGHVKGAFTRQDIGDIDLVWGDEAQGLCHLIKRRKDENSYPAKDVLDKLAETIENGVLQRGKSGNFEIWHKGIMAIVRPEYYGEDIRFIVTGFKQRKPNKNPTSREDAIPSIN